MNYFSDDTVAWQNCKEKDLWVFDKLILARKLRYKAGPIGLNVPEPNHYIVRPITNTLGMGRDVHKIWIADDTSFLPLGHFWCEFFTGEHLSVDFYKKKPYLIVKGIRDSDSFYKWRRWEVVQRNVEFPSILNDIDSDWINVEFIGNKVIEVHLRRNPDFRHGNTVAIPVWYDDEFNVPPGMTFVSDKDYHRIGFYIDKKDK